MLRVLPPALVPMPKDVVKRVWTFAAPEIFAREATTFVVAMEFET